MTTPKTKVSFLGTGDAFGHGGRLQACIFIESGGTGFLMDCGASAMISLHRFGVEPNRVEFVLLSHLHADHFGGLPFFILDAQLFSKRQKPLLVAGPPGTKECLPKAMDIMFPGSAGASRKFEMEIVELTPGVPRGVCGVEITPFAASHTGGDVRLFFRVECGGKVIAYSGDTAWSDELPLAARGADLLIAEAYFHDKQVPDHLDYATLLARQQELGARRTIITHLSQDLLDRLDGLELEAAHDGLVLEL